MSGGVLLDVGCHEGYLKEFMNSKFRIWGVDNSESNCKKSLARGYEMVENADLEKGIPFPDESCDGVFAGEVLEHLFQTDLFLDEIFRVLKPGGFLLVSTPNLSYLIHILLILKGKQLVKVMHKHDLKERGHVSYFSPETLVAELNRAGFNNVELYPYLHPHYSSHAKLLKLLFSSSRRLRARHNPYLIALANKPWPYLEK